MSEELNLAKDAINSFGQAILLIDAQKVQIAALEMMVKTQDELIKLYEKQEICLKFTHLSYEWKRKSAHLSNVTRKSNLPEYQEIIKLGRPVVEFIIHDLKENGPNDWFVALTEITGENPILPQMQGKMEEMSQAWINWFNNCERSEP